MKTSMDEALLDTPERVDSPTVREVVALSPLGKRECFLGTEPCGKCEVGVGVVSVVRAYHKSRLLVVLYAPFIMRAYDQCAPLSALAKPQIASTLFFLFLLLFPSSSSSFREFRAHVRFFCPRVRMAPCTL